MQPVDFHKDGFIYMSDKPGLGIEWDEQAIERFKVS
jgi:L-alanine-DL-glutamate epimerase-like enolase superfamily enzyme